MCENLGAEGISGSCEGAAGSSATHRTHQSMLLVCCQAQIASHAEDSNSRVTCMQWWCGRLHASSKVCSCCDVEVLSTDTFCKMPCSSGATSNTAWEPCKEPFEQQQQCEKRPIHACTWHSASAYVYASYIAAVHTEYKKRRTEVTTSRRCGE